MRVLKGRIRAFRRRMFMSLRSPRGKVWLAQGNPELNFMWDAFDNSNRAELQRLRGVRIQRAD
jgi:hypothetical protein